MADLMSDHIGPGELALGPELGLQLVPERQVEIDLLVLRAIERSHRRLAQAAARPGGLVVQHDRGRRGVVGDHGLPHLVGGGPDHVDKLGRLVGRRAAHPLLLLSRALALQAVDHRKRGAGIDAEEEIARRRQQQGADAAAAEHGRMQAAPVLDIALAVAAFPFHENPPGKAVLSGGSSAALA